MTEKNYTLTFHTEVPAVSPTAEEIKINLLGHPWIATVETIVHSAKKITLAIGVDAERISADESFSPDDCFVSTLMEIGWGWYTPDPDDAEKFVMTRDGSHGPSTEVEIESQNFYVPGVAGNHAIETPSERTIRKNKNVRTERKPEMKNTETEILVSLPMDQKRLAVLALTWTDLMLMDGPKPTMGITVDNFHFLKIELVCQAVSDLVVRGVLNDDLKTLADSLVQNISEDLAEAATTDHRTGAEQMPEIKGTVGDPVPAFQGEDRTQKFLDDMKDEPRDDDDLNCGYCGTPIASHDDAVCQRDHGGPDAGGVDPDVEILEMRIRILETEANDSNNQRVRQNTEFAALEASTKTRIAELEDRVVRYSLRIADLKNSVQVMKNSSDEIAVTADILYQAAQGILIDKRIPTSRKSEIETAVSRYENPNS